MRDLKLRGEVILHPASSGRTSERVERALGIPRASVLKVLVFKSQEEYVAAIVTGDERVDVKRLERLTGLKDLRLASPEDVKSLTGFPVGGVPPFVFKDLCPVFVDEGVLSRDYVVGSAGSEYAGVRFSPQEFRKLNYSVTRITRRQA